VSFNVAATSYDRFMGRFSEPLAMPFLEVAGLRPGQRALDVGCGPGALTTQLVSLLGPDRVSAVDPSEPFVAAAKERFPGVDIRQGPAESLPFDDHTFDASLAQLVVHFMKDPVEGLREMGRVTVPGGVVAACVWDQAGGTGFLPTFWRAVKDLDPGAVDESGLAGAREGHLAELAEAAGLGEIVESKLTVAVPMASFAEWWDPYTLGVGPSGAYVAGLDEARRESLMWHCAELLPPAPFDVLASAWCVRATVPA
jgi:SAM-dependent methyltransferase